MKTKEFKEKVSALGYYSEDYGARIDIKPYTQSLTVIAKVLPGSLGFFIYDENDSRVTELVKEYGMTPVDERKEEKKYRYEFPFALTMSEIKTRHICRNHIGGESGESNELILDSSSLEHVIKYKSFHFTDKEVEQYGGVDHALFYACEKIEVAE